MSGPLSGVVVSLSGYQNPERGNMRDAACSLGADYCPDFNDRVSHLVCAFVGSTPKIESAKRAKATIVMGDWLTECKAKGKRLPVDDYLMFPQLRRSSSSVPRAASPSSKASPSTSPSPSKKPRTAPDGNSASVGPPPPQGPPAATQATGPPHPAPDKAVEKKKVEDKKDRKSLAEEVEGWLPQDIELYREHLEEDVVPGLAGDAWSDVDWVHAAKQGVLQAIKFAAEVVEADGNLDRYDMEWDAPDPSGLQSLRDLLPSSSAAPAPPSSAQATSAILKRFEEMSAAYAEAVEKLK